MPDRVYDEAVCGTGSVCWDLAACNEDGWRCTRCGSKAGGDPPGYRPDLDRSEIGSKVETVMMILHHSGLIYISNSSEGESLVGDVARHCERSGLFDQYSIIWLIMRRLAPGHGEFWKKIGDGVVAGADLRERCWCGKLATGSSGIGMRWCSLEHNRGGGLFAALESDEDKAVT
jgi:hypothetical protein